MGLPVMGLPSRSSFLTRQIPLSNFLQSKAPDKLLAEMRDANGKVIRTRPLLPWPQVAKYNGNGSTDEEENFRSKEGN
jgi:hypothetical protein